MNFRSFGALADHIDRIIGRLPAAELIFVAEAGEIVAERAKSKLGTYQAGWPPLAASTLAEKERLGYPIPSPLKRTRQMHDSIGSKPEGKTVRIGAAAPAQYHEHGTSIMPPRPFMGPAMRESRDPVKAAGVRMLSKAFRGR